MNDDQPRNHLDMYQLYQDGPYVLPQTKCTNRRIDFVGRANSILASLPLFLLRQNKDWIRFSKRNEKEFSLTTLHLDSISFPAVPVRI